MESQTPLFPPGAVDVAGTDLTLVVRAFHFAATKHRLQKRKDALHTPFINHLIDVAQLLVCEGEVRDPVVIAAAVLHDVLEDTNTSPAELREEFGPRLASIVEEVSDYMWVSQRLRRRLQTNRASRSSSQAKLVKLADKICNLRDILRSPPAGWRVERKREYFDWAKSVVDGLRGTSPPLERRFDRLFEHRP